MHCSKNQRDKFVPPRKATAQEQWHPRWISTATEKSRTRFGEERADWHQGRNTRYGPVPLLLSSGLVLLMYAPARAEINVTDPGTFVVDKAGIIDASFEQQIEGWLRELEQKTTAQIKLLTVQTTDGEDVFGFGMRHAERWKLGRAGKDNGALVVIALNEREFRVLTGYGLEPTLPDSWCGQLTREVVIPAFRAGNYSQGAFNAMTAIANRVADASNVQLTGIPQYRFAPKPKRRVGGLGVIPIIIIILLLTRGRRGRHRRRWGGGLGEAIFWGSVFNNMSRGGRSWGGGGFGGGFGGGGGGFGGSFGGGGRFGGGGGGGRW